MENIPGFNPETKPCGLQHRRPLSSSVAGPVHASEGVVFNEILISFSRQREREREICFGCFGVGCFQERPQISILAINYGRKLKGKSESFIFY